MTRNGFKSFGKPQGVKSQKHGSSHTGFAPTIKNKAVHVKKVSVPTLKSLANPASNNTSGTTAPGSNSNTKYAPKSNATKATYKNAGKQMN